MAGMEYYIPKMDGIPRKKSDIVPDEGFNPETEPLAVHRGALLHSWTLNHSYHNYHLVATITKVGSR